MTTVVPTVNEASGVGAVNGHDADGSPVRALGHGAMWVYIVGDLFIFGGWFVFYLVYRAGEHAIFAESQAHSARQRA